MQDMTVGAATLPPPMRATRLADDVDGPELLARAADYRDGVDAATVSDHAVRGAPMSGRGAFHRDLRARVDDVVARVHQGTAAMQPYPDVGGNKVTLIPTVREFYEELRGQLQRTDLRTLNVSEYAWYRNGFGKDAARIVRALALDGVDVASTTDMMGTRSKFGSFQQSRIRRAGGEVAEHRPWMGSVADHRKLFVINGDTMYLTGVGLGKKYQSNWEDLTVKIEGPAAAWGQAEHLARLRDMGGEVSDVQRQVLADALRNPVEQGQAGVRLLTMRPGQPNSVAEFIDGAFARRDLPLVVGTSFFADPDRAAALARAAAEGRDVTVVMTPLSWKRQRRQFFPDAVSRTYVDRMVRAGVKVIEPETFFHGKAVLVPGDPTYTMGSANMSASNFHELNAAITDPDSAADLLRYFDDQVDRGTRMTPAMFDNAVDDALRAVVQGLKLRC